MTLQSIIDQFDLLMDTPDSVPKLRQFILQLAVQGKLTEQDPDDEPASNTVADSKIEIKQLYSDGKITRPSRRPQVEQKEKVFDIPDGWTWTRLGNVLALVNGRAYKKEELLDEGTPVMRIQNLGGGGSWYYSDLDLPPKKYCNYGDLLYAWSGTFGPYIWDGQKAIFHYHIWRIELTRAVTKKYAYHLLKAVSADVEADAHGIMLPHMTKGGMEKLAIPLPPLEEQQRIVATVDRLMDACDTLEAQQEAAAQVRARATASATQALQTAATSAAVRTAWHRLRDHFDVLTATPDDVDALRQTILQLAVQGKLTEQDPDDEPAEELLKRIKAEKQRLYEAGEIRKPKSLPSITDDVVPFEIPPNWVWTRIAEICNLENGDRSKNYPKRSELVDSGIPFINAGHLQDGEVDFTEMNYIPEARFGLLRSGKVTEGDVLFCLRGSLGKCAIINDIKRGAIASSLVIVRPLVEFASAYLLMYFGSALCEQMIDHYDNGTAQPNLGSSSLAEFLIPLPPVEEQRRIVNTVDRLMGICDRLEAQLSQQQELGVGLLEAALHGATQRDGELQPV